MKHLSQQVHKSVILIFCKHSEAKYQSRTDPGLDLSGSYCYKLHELFIEIYSVYKWEIQEDL